MEIVNELAREIKGQTNRAVDKATSYLGFELGTITSNGLKLDNFKHEIKNYKILDYLNLKNQYNTEPAGEHLHNHIFNTPKELKPIASGDRVLVAAIGTEYIVVGRVVDA